MGNIMKAAKDHLASLRAGKPIGVLGFSTGASWSLVIAENESDVSVAMLFYGAGEADFSGVLFLDEFPEFGTRVLEVMRQPMEDKVVTINRAKGSLTFSANFQLIAAMNPCPCGYYGDSLKPCTCALVVATNIKSKSQIHCSTTSTVKTNCYMRGLSNQY